MTGIGRVAATALIAAALLTSAACEDEAGGPEAAGPSTTAAGPSMTAAGPSTTAAPAPTASRATRCPEPETGPVDAGSVLVPGPTNGLPRSDARGDKLVITAVVVDAACAPAAGANLTIWHTDARGEYRPKGTDACCYYQGTVRTDRNGRFRVDTIRPGQYPVPDAPPAHVHFEVTHPAGRLDTEIVFAAEPSPPAYDPASEQIAIYLRSVPEAQGTTWYGEVIFMLRP